MIGNVDWINNASATLWWGSTCPYNVRHKGERIHKLAYSPPTGGHFACACVNPLNDNKVGASNLMAGNRKLARKVTVLLKANSLVLWIPYFPTKKNLHDMTFAEVFLVSLIITLIWGERQDFEINKPAKGWKTVSRQNGQLINNCIPETIKFDFRVILLRRMKYLWDNCLTKYHHTDLFLLLKKCARNVRSQEHSAAILSSMYWFTNGKTVLSSATARLQ